MNRLCCGYYTLHNLSHELQRWSISFNKTILAAITWSNSQGLIETSCFYVPSKDSGSTVTLTKEFMENE